MSMCAPDIHRDTLHLAAPEPILWFPLLPSFRVVSWSPIDLLPPNMSAPADLFVPKVAPGDVSPVLVKRAAAGEELASRALWDHFGPLVRRFLRRMLGPAFDPGDLLQEIFLGIFKGLPRLRNQESVRSFVFAVASNHVRLEFRRRKRKALFEYPVPEPCPEIPAVDGDPDAQIAARHLYRMLDKLNVRDRELLVLRFLEGLSLPEVAEQSGVSLATAKRHLNRAAGVLAELAREDPFVSWYLPGLPGGQHGER